MTKIICNFLDFLGNSLNFLLPSISDTGVSQVSDAVLFFVKFISAADYLFPVSTLFTVIGIVVSYKLFMVSWWVINWILKAVLDVIP